MLEIKGTVNTAICYATVIEDEAIEHKPITRHNIRERIIAMFNHNK